MTQSAKLQTIQIRAGKKPLFGPAPETATTLRDRLERIAGAPAQKQSVANQLSARLQEKYRNYERAALRLELRGEHDAAKLLRQAAARASLLRNKGEDPHGGDA